MFENGRFFTSDVTQRMQKNRFFLNDVTQDTDARKNIPSKPYWRKTILTNNMTQHTKGTLFMGNYSLPVPPAHVQQVYSFLRDSVCL